MYGIAQKQLYNLIDEDENSNPYTGDEEPAEQLVQVDTTNMTVEQRKIVREKYELINNALDRLGRKHRVIYCTYAFYHQHYKLTSPTNDRIDKLGEWNTGNQSDKMINFGIFRSDTANVYISVIPGQAYRLKMGHSYR